MTQAKAPLIPESEQIPTLVVVDAVCARCGAEFASLELPVPPPNFKPPYPALVGNAICHSCWPDVKRTYGLYGPAAALAMLNTADLIGAT